jgi:hypothetical protein
MNDDDEAGERLTPRNVVIGTATIAVFIAV